MCWSRYILADLIPIYTFFNYYLLLMNLTPMQLYCQNEIVKRAHPWCTLNIAKKKDLKFWCLVKWGIYLCKWRWMPNEVLQTEQDHEPLSNWYQPFPVPRVTEDNYRDQPEYIIGLPPTLARVLNALGWDYWYDNDRGSILNHQEDKLMCVRELLNEDWTDATLRDQSEETQESIALLLGWKDA